MKISRAAKNAIIMGGLLAFSYLAVYIARNMLGAVTPLMIEDGYSKESIASISSIFLFTYAIGHLINGLIGDRIKAKFMIPLGLFGGGLTCLIFPFVIDSYIVALGVYGLTGFFLSMIYAPMTKVVAENIEKEYAHRCALGYNFSSFLGSPLSGILASIMIWQSVFVTGSFLLVIMALLCFALFLSFEKKGIIKDPEKKKSTFSKENVGMLFKHHIVRFSFVAILTGIIRTSVIFWIPTYINQYLGFSPKVAALLYTVTTVMISASAFISVFVYEKLGYNMFGTLFIMFFASAIFFLLSFFVSSPIVNLIFITIAITAANCSSSILWIIYCPSLKDTGMVSSATGFLDCLSYGAAAVANILFANAATTIGWGNLILIWSGISFVGVFTAIMRKNQKNKRNT